LRPGSPKTKANNKGTVLIGEAPSAKKFESTRSEKAERGLKLISKAGDMCWVNGLLQFGN